MQSTNFIAGYTQNIFCICHVHNYTKIFWMKTRRLLTGPVCIQKVFSSLHNSQIEPLMTILMVFHTFLDLDSVIYLADNGTVTSRAVTVLYFSLPR